MAARWALSATRFDAIRLAVSVTCRSGPLPGRIALARTRVTPNSESLQEGYIVPLEAEPATHGIAKEQQPGNVHRLKVRDTEAGRFAHAVLSRSGPLPGCVAAARARVTPNSESPQEENIVPLAAAPATHGVAKEQQPDQIRPPKVRDTEVGRLAHAASMHPWILLALGNPLIELYNAEVAAVLNFRHYPLRHYAKRSHAPRAD